MNFDVFLVWAINISFLLLIRGGGGKRDAGVWKGLGWLGVFNHVRNMVEKHPCPTWLRIQVRVADIQVPFIGERAATSSF